MLAPDFPFHRPELHDRLRRGSGAVNRALLQREQLFEAGTRIIRAGEQHDVVYRVRTGWACRTATLDDSRRQIISLFLPTELCGVKSLLFAKQPDTLECLTAVTVNWIEAHELQAMADRDPDVALRIAFHLAAEEQQLHTRLMSLGRASASEKLAAFFLDVHHRTSRLNLEPASPFTVPMSQQQIGDYLGMTVVHANRVLRIFRERNLVTMTRKRVVLHDVGALAELAGELFKRPSSGTDGIGTESDATP